MPRTRCASVRVGKYVELHDAYLSVAEALRHAGYAHGVRVSIDWIDSSALDARTCADRLGDLDGVIVPGGFGQRGVEGMVSAVRFARERNIPFLGICMGMQAAVIEFARNVAGLRRGRASSTRHVPRR